MPPTTREPSTHHTPVQGSSGLILKVNPVICIILNDYENRKKIGLGHIYLKIIFGLFSIVNELGGNRYALVDILDLYVSSAPTSTLVRL
jgi:dolichol kinase